MNFRYLTTIFSVLTLGLPLVIAAPATAADYSTIKAQTNDWQGFYAGVAGGLGGTGIDFRGIGVDGQTDIDDSKYNIAAIAGYNFTSGPWLLGLEGDLGRMGFDKTSAVPGLGNISATSNWEASMGLRGGYAFDSFLVYGKAGVAFTDLKVSSSLGGSSDKWRTGLMLGVGAEYAVANDWLIRGELTAYTFRSDVNIAGTNREFDFGEGVARVGLTHKF
jgi:outer membrane immunogenic protein